MKDLIERLEKLDGPCRECDQEIERLLWPVVFENCVQREDGRYVHSEFGLIAQPQHYSESIDAALTLIPDGWELGILQNVMGLYICGLQNDDGDKLVGSHATIPVAICIAVLRAQLSLLIEGER